MKIKKILIANRGEIAVRVIRAAQELGIETVQVFSDADADSLAVKLADVSENIGLPMAAKSYLNMDAILGAAKKHQVDAIHPGYGFFAENADFADAVVNSGFIFIGPSGDTIRTMGDKVAARQAAHSAGVPIVPGSDGRIDDLDEAAQIAIDVGFPLLIKAAAGGGGRGIRIVESLDEFKSQALEASAEAQAAFGDGGLYIERYITRSRHIEVQILADGDRAVHIFDRECSLQRRRQKVWEEAPSAALPEKIRHELCSSAIRLAEAVNYRGAATVEYLFDDISKEYFFIEMNTRIQVEHPVSELICGIDLIREMINLAGGQSLNWAQNEIQARGHAIEVRINAEDPSMDFMPFPGLIGDINYPQGPGVRFDGMIYPGYAIPPYYDSLLGKLIVWDVDRHSAIARLKRALNEFEINGVKTTIPLFKALVNDPDVINGDFDTKWLEHWLDKNVDKLFI